MSTFKRDSEFMQPPLLCLLFPDPVSPSEYVMYGRSLCWRGRRHRIRHTKGLNTYLLELESKKFFAPLIPAAGGFLASSLKVSTPKHATSKADVKFISTFQLFMSIGGSFVQHHDAVQMIRRNWHTGIISVKTFNEM